MPTSCKQLRPFLQGFCTTFLEDILRIFVASRGPYYLPCWVFQHDLKLSVTSSIYEWEGRNVRSRVVPSQTMSVSLLGNGCGCVKSKDPAQVLGQSLKERAMKQTLGPNFGHVRQKTTDVPRKICQAACPCVAPTLRAPDYQLLEHQTCAHAVLPFWWASEIPGWIYNICEGVPIKICSRTWDELDTLEGTCQKGKPPAAKLPMVLNIPMQSVCLISALDGLVANPK